MVDGKSLDDMDKVRKLSPEARIKKLNELEKIKEEIRKKEALESERLIQQSVAEIKAEEVLKDEIEEEERLQRKLELDTEEDLEEKVNHGRQAVIDEELSKHKQYQLKLSMEPITNLYEKLRDISQDVVSNGEINNEQERQLRDLGYAMQYKSEAIDHGDYKTAGEQIEDIMSASKSILNYIRKGV